MPETTIRLTVVEVERVGYNSNGQPRCRIIWEFPQMIRESAMTKSGAGFLIAGDPKPGEYDIDFNGRHQITDMRAV